MGNLIDEVGTDYITQFFQGAVFNYNGSTYMLNSVYGDAVAATKLEGAPMSDKPSLTPCTVSLEAVDSFMKFAWPKLGYRNVINSTTGVAQCVHLNSVRSTRRGLSSDQLLITFPEAVSLWVTANGSSITTTACMFNAFNPHFYSYPEALKLLATKKAVGVAINEDICITYSVSTDAPLGAAYDIHFKSKVVGHIMANGEVVFSNTNMLRMKFLSKTFMEHGK